MNTLRKNGLRYLMRKVYFFFISMLLILILWSYFSASINDEDSFTTIVIELAPDYRLFSPDQVILHEENIIFLRNGQSSVDEIKVFNVKKNRVDISFEEKLFKPGLIRIRQVEGNLYGLIDNRINRFSNGAWISAGEFKKKVDISDGEIPKNFLKLIYSDEIYDIYCSDAGSSGASVLFHDKGANSYLGNNMTLPVEVIRINKSYWIKGAISYGDYGRIQVKRFNAPKKLTKIINKKFVYEYPAFGYIENARLSAPEENPWVTDIYDSEKCYDKSAYKTSAEINWNGNLYLCSADDKVKLTQIGINQTEHKSITLLNNNKGLYNVSQSRFNKTLLLSLFFHQGRDENIVLCFIFEKGEIRKFVFR